MVDFRKKLSKGEIDKKTHPVEIYETLDRRSIAGPLRPAQNYILNEWYVNNQKSKDLIIKLHTGEGKTLIGLLILQSKLNQNEGPCIFVCPNIYLVQQVAQEATKFGIQYCLIEEDNQIPNDFLNGKRILITHIQKLFNGRSVFGIDNNYTEFGTVIFDDSHACIDSIKNSFTIRIKNGHELYNKIIQMFENDLREQGEGSLLDILSGNYNTFLPIPYWSWIDKKSEVTTLLSKFTDEKMLFFTWPLLKNSIQNCQCFVSGSEIEIVPYYMPIENFGSFSKAKQRILMSATTQDDSFFIKGLGFEINAVKNPLIFTTQKWSGEKMLLIPSLIDESLDRDLIITKLAPPGKYTFGRVMLVPSYKKAEQYKQESSIVTTSEDIFGYIKLLKKNIFDKSVTIVNRYDGIDLPDEACRILIIDSLPYFNSLSDKYEEQCRSNSDILNIKMAQKIEQGLGRSVRGEKDYSIIILIGTDLVKFIKSVKTNNFFSAQTRKQIEIGLGIVELAREEINSEDSEFNVLRSLMNQALQRDEGWKEYYKEEMNKIEFIDSEITIHNILQLEKNAEVSFLKGNVEDACKKMQLLIDREIQDDSERGWYLQILARYTYFISKSESNKIQISAFQNNSQLLKPKDGINYKKIEYINENRIKRIKNWIAEFKSYDELSLHINSLLDDFSFGVDSEKFENAVKEIGEILGFISQRPDKEYKKGPDNLWCGVDNKYFLIECKSEVEESRDEINKYEAGQMNSHCGWFENEYGDMPVKRILIIPTKNLSYYGNFTHKVEILRKGKLKHLKAAIKSFIKEFKAYNIHEISDGKIQEFINIHKLDIKSLENEYTEAYTMKKR